MAYKGETICGVHDSIIKKANEIMKLKARNFETVEDVLDEVQSLADDIEDLAEKAKDMGQSMEDCIVTRRRAIESAMSELDGAL